jgi:hypothetical protein
MAVLEVHPIFVPPLMAVEEGKWLPVQRNKRMSDLNQLPIVAIICCPGHCYAQRKRSSRRRATYVGRGGVGYCFGGYDVHADVLFGGYRLAKTTHEVLAFYKYMRRRYPDHLRSSTTICRCTGRRRSAPGPSRTISSWFRRRLPPATSTASSATSDPCASSS